MRTPTSRARWLFVALAIVLQTQIAHSQVAAGPGVPPQGKGWMRHTIDNGSRGADGVRLADVNGDGRPDITTGWEEGGQVRLYLHPGPAECHQPWPRAIVGQAAAVEDAVWVDLNGDGSLDIVASCEGQHRSLIAFLAGGKDPLAAETWQRMAFPQLQGAEQWMYALPLTAPPQQALRLVVGSKGPNASVSLLTAPATPPLAESTPLADWRIQRLADAGWIMSLVEYDVDGDGDGDVVYSDRRGRDAGVWWLENPANPGQPQQAQATWPRHAVTGLGQEVMFLDVADINGDGRPDVAAAVSGGDLLLAIRVGDADSVQWQQSRLPMPGGVGTGKAVAVGDIDLDGKADLIVSCENARQVSGLFWLRATSASAWEAHDISGIEHGIKFDRMELVDVDEDGDVDVITCEERDNLGVIWYENPTRAVQR